MQGNLKLDAFTVSFSDIQLDVDGVPLTIACTYDSRRKSQETDALGNVTQYGYDELGNKTSQTRRGFRSIRRTVLIQSGTVFWSKPERWRGWMDVVGGGRKLRYPPEFLRTAHAQHGRRAARVGLSSSGKGANGGRGTHLNRRQAAGIRKQAGSRYPGTWGYFRRESASGVLSRSLPIYSVQLSGRLFAASAVVCACVRELF